MNALPSSERAAPASASPPPASYLRRSTIAVTALAGLAIGIALFTFDYAEGLSYLSEDPAACINCHVMQEQYDGWLHGSHHSKATCNDCHVPHDSLAHKFYVKAEHGYRHSKGFTLNNFHEPIQITPGSRAVVAENCMRCHESVADDTIVHTASPHQFGRPGVEPADCLHCHTRVGHGPTR